MPVGTGVDATMAVLSSTLNAFVQKYIEPTIFDQVLKHTPVLYRFWRKGPVIDGGAALTWPILKAKKTTGGWYSGAQQLPHGVADTIEPAEVNWRHIAEDVSIPRTDLLKARTPYAKVDLIKTKFDEAILLLRQRISAGLFHNIDPASKTPTSLGIDHLFMAIDAGGATVNGTVNIDGTAIPVQVAGFASYAGIAHTNTYWQGNVTNQGGAVTALSQLQSLYGKASDGDEQPTLCVTTQAGFDFIWSQVQAQQRFVRDEEMTKAGFEAFKFNRAVVVVDRLLPDNTLLFLNEAWVDLVSHEEENFAVDPILPGTPSERTINTKIVWSGNLRSKILRYHAKLIGATNF